MAVAGNAIDRTPKSVEAAPASAVGGGTRVKSGAMAARKTAVSAATNQKDGRVFTMISTSAPDGVSKRTGPQSRAAPPRTRAPAARPTLLATGCPVFSAIR